MERRFTILIVAALMLVGVRVNAQQDTTAVDSTKRSIYYASAHASTQGIGLEFKYSPEAQFNFRAGFSMLPLKTDGVYSVKSEPTDINLKAEFSNAHLMFDWHPFIKTQNFASKLILTAGAGYFWKAKGDAVISYRGTYNYGDMPISSEELGQLIGAVKWNKVAPYAGFGFENAFPKHKFNMGFALGTYYMGKPDVHLTGTKLLTKNNQNEEQLRKNMSGYRFLPVLQINFNYSLN
jgi:hypothetical protein